MCGADDLSATSPAMRLTSYLEPLFFISLYRLQRFGNVAPSVIEFPERCRVSVIRGRASRFLAEREEARLLGDGTLLVQQEQQVSLAYQRPDQVITFVDASQKAEDYFERAILARRSELPVSSVRTRSVVPAIAKQVCPAGSP